MSQYIVRRAMLTALTLLLFSAMLFVLVRLLPGDTALLKSAADVSPGSADPAAIASLREHYGLDHPVFIQFLRWIASVSHGDFGRSFWTGDAAFSDLLTGLPVTVELVVLSVFFSVIIGLVVGVMSAVFRDRPLDHALRLFALFGLSIPNFWVGI